LIWWCFLVVVCEGTHYPLVQELENILNRDAYLRSLVLLSFSEQVTVQTLHLLGLSKVSTIGSTTSPPSYHHPTTPFSTTTPSCVPHKPLPASQP